jgi:hypothetical protein
VFESGETLPIYVRAISASLKIGPNPSFLPSGSCTRSFFHHVSSSIQTLPTEQSSRQVGLPPIQQSSSRRSLPNQQKRQPHLMIPISYLSSLETLESLNYNLRNSYRFSQDREEAYWKLFISPICHTARFAIPSFFSSGSSSIQTKSVSYSIPVYTNTTVLNSRATQCHNSTTRERRLSFNPTIIRCRYKHESKDFQKRHALNVNFKLTEDIVSFSKISLFAMIFLDRNICLRDRRPDI